jgi:CheY-like chemotaxis protein/two-component sensor histidine kinase
MASMGMLAAGIAHEINNPLAAIVGNLELASSELSALAEERSLPTALLEELRDAADAAGRVRSIVRDLRIFSRAEEELISAVDVRQVLESTLRMAWNEVRHRARLVTSYEDVPPVAANESRLGQVFLNLILNAAQAIPEGHADSNQIRVSTGLDQKGDVCIDFADTGDGMSAEVRRRAFDPFFTTKPAGIGTGLGLAICARIVGSFGGNIEVESTLGAGSRFRVRLPASERAAAALEPCRDAPTVTRRGRVLVIDDEALMGVVIRRALEPMHEVLVCSRAREALERLVAGEHFDVILCDIMMPELTGAEFYQALQQRAPQLVERIVFVTGGAFTAVAREFLERSTNPRVDKPFDLAALRALVDERIQRLEAPAVPLAERRC